MYRPHDTAAMEWAVKRGRLRYASAMFGRDELRPALRHLKQGGALWFAPDQDTLRAKRVRAVLRRTGTQPDLDASVGAHVRRGGVRVFPPARTRWQLHAGGQARVRGLPSSDAAADTARVMAAIEAMARRTGAVPVAAQALQAPARGAAPILRLIRASSVSTPSSASHTATSHSSVTPERGIHRVMGIERKTVDDQCHAGRMSATAAASAHRACAAPAERSQPATIPTPQTGFAESSSTMWWACEAPSIPWASTVIIRRGELRIHSGTRAPDAIDRMRQTHVPCGFPDR